MLIDTHCHLSLPIFTHLRGEVINRAKSGQIGKLVCVSTDLVDSSVNIELAKRYAGFIYAGVGIHPCDIFEFDHSDFLNIDYAYRELSRLANGGEVVAIGETGLDYYHKPSSNIDDEDSRKRQIDFLQLNLRVADESGKNVILHSRGECWDDLLGVVKSGLKNSIAVFHCFSGGKDIAKKILDMNCFVSLTGIITYKSGASLHDVIKYIPIDRIMLETDAPYLTPEPYRKQRKRINEPIYIESTAKKLAEIKATTLEDVAKQTTKNAESFFKF